MKINQAQRQALTHKEGPMLVLAGPGSGKTLVITERTKYLIEECNIPEENILVITFTKAAANEMKHRFLRSRKANRTAVNFGTFHAIFFTILKYAYRFNGNNIVREEARLQYMKEIVHGLKLEYEDEKEFINDLLSEISLVKGNQMDLNNYYSTNCAVEVFRRVYQEYNHRLRKANLIDFDDMLLYCYELLSERSDILALWQRKFQYILIDEFQDINKVQYEIIKLLAKSNQNLFIVGDDDQSIYRFRGAKPEIMLNFPKDYPDCKKVVLNINYRSTANIVEVSNRLIQHNKQRFPKEIQTEKAEGLPIAMQQYDTMALENQAVAGEIIRLQKMDISLADMAILVRTNLGSGALIHKLMEYNIPFQMRDGLPNIFEHWITGDLLCYIKIAMGSQERGLFLQIINRPKRYVSRDCFDSPTVDLDSIKDYFEDKNWMLERLDQLEYDLAIMANMKPYAAIHYIRKGIGYEDYLKEYADQRRIKVDELLDVLDEVQESAREFDSYQQWFAHMDQYKEELKRQSNHQEDGVDRVTIATMHSAKGLEYQVVFIVDANEGITPHKKAVLAEDVEEERRLFYVAMTRAKEYLYILSAKERYNKTEPRSRFVDEVLGINSNGKSMKEAKLKSDLKK